MAGIFYAMAALVIVGALGVVLCRNVVHSALLLTASFIGVACLYLYLDAAFLGAAQIMVYGGAVAILIGIAIMLTRRERMSASNPLRSRAHVAGAAALALGFLALMSCVVFKAAPEITATNALTDSVTGLARMMLNRYILPVELAAVLLLVALIGAIVLAKEAD